MIPLIFGELGEKKGGALLHLLLVHIKNLGAHFGSAIPIAIHEDNLRVAFARSIVVAGERRNFEALGKQ